MLFSKNGGVSTGPCPSAEVVAVMRDAKRTVESNPKAIK